MCRGSIRVLTTCVAFCSVAALSSAATLLDQPPSHEFGIFSDEGCDALIYSPSFGHPQSIADNFVVDNSGAGFVIDQVVIWGNFEPYSTSTMPLGDDVDVLIHADDNGLPGVTLWAELGVVADRVDTGYDIGNPPFQKDEYMVTLTLATPWALPDGTYWVEVYYNTGLGHDDWVWGRSTTVPTAGPLGIAWAPETPGTTWGEVSTSTFPNVALQINGTPGQVSCVDTAAELQSALNDAGANGVDDVIHVVQGSYVTPGQAFLYATSESHSLQLLGGFTTDCATRELDPTNTVLDGDHATAVLHLAPAPTTNGRIVVEGFTITGGATSDTGVAGLEIGNTAFYGSLTVAHNAILDNHSSGGNGGLALASGGGILHLLNNLIAGNSSSTARGAGILESDGEAIWVVNNTVADNTCSGCLGGLAVLGDTGPYLSNNILWSNDSYDLSFTNSAMWLENNDIGSYDGVPDPGSSGNLSVDPEFTATSNYRLTVDSPLLDQGTDTVPGGLPATDLDGMARVQSDQVDIGAYEIPLIFLSHFEAVDLGDWTEVYIGP